MENKTTIDFKKLALLLTVSMFTALFAYAFIYFITNITTLYFSTDFHIPAHFDFSGITFEVDRTNELWTYDAIVTIFLSGLVVALFVGVVSMLAILFVRKKNISFFFLLLWLNILSFNNVMGTLISDVVTKSGTYQVVLLMHIDIIIFIVIGILSAYFLFRIGMINLFVFETSFSQFFHKGLSNRLYFLVSVIVIPWLLILLLPLLLNSAGFQLNMLIKNISLVFVFLPLFIIKPRIKDPSSIQKHLQLHLSDLMATTLFTMMAWFLFYLISNGITY